MKLFRLLLILFIILTISDFSYAKNPQAETDLDSALQKAKAEGKMLFIQYGREKCGNCQALKALISKNILKLSARKFVYVDLDCDDPKIRKAFNKLYTVRGSTLPFVVIADSNGKQLVARSGYGDLKDYQDLITEAKRKNRRNSVIQQKTKTGNNLKPTTEKKTIEDIRKKFMD